MLTCSLLYTIAKMGHSRSLNNILLDFSKQCTDAKLEGLSNITTQTCYPLCGHKKLNKLDDSKKFSILGIGIESEKIMETR